MRLTSPLFPSFCTRGTQRAAMLGLALHSSLAVAQTQGEFMKSLAPLQKLWHEGLHQHVLWQLLWVLVVMGLCYVGTRSLTQYVFQRLLHWQPPQKNDERDEFSQLAKGSLHAVVFPLSTSLILVISQIGYERLMLQWFNLPLSVLPVVETAVPIFLALAGIRMVLFLLRQTFSPSGFLASFERLITAIVWGIVVLWMSGLKQTTLSILQNIVLPMGSQSLSLWTILTGLTTLMVALVLALWMANLVDRRIRKVPQMQGNLRLLLSRLFRALILVAATLISLASIGIDISSISLIGGALGVGIGFGLQKIASNYISGFIILLERSVRLGDAVGIGTSGIEGWVTKITTRYTVVNDMRGVEHIVPNELFINEVVRSRSLSDKEVLVNQSVQVAYDTDIPLAIDLLSQAAAAHDFVKTTPKPTANLLSFDDSGITLELAYWVGRPEDTFKANRSLVNIKILQLFREHKISIPFPQREVRVFNAVAAEAP